ncbi:MAG TPA: hypothetical protein VGC41_11055, partial [Kofleriaceae bacterium]
MRIVDDTSGPDGIEATCDALGVCRASYYRSRRPRVYGPRYQMRCPRSLLPEERQEVLGLFHEDRFADLAPAQVYAILLDEGRYICSERTMYRVLTSNLEIRERRALLMHPRYEAPELLATKPNQLWSWDITKLFSATRPDATAAFDAPTPIVFGTQANSFGDPSFSPDAKTLYFASDLA